MEEIFGTEKPEIEKYIKESFCNHERVVLGHDCYFLIYDPLNDEEPFDQYIKEKIYTTFDIPDEEHEIIYDKEMDKLYEQLQELENNGLVCLGF